MFALVDANSFYASAEEVFNPSIRGKPIVVLTNNDGCICAMSNAAKQSGIKGFVPYHTVKEQLSAINAVIRSSNYALYADLSHRVSEVLGRFAEQHIYSIDESFLKFEDTQLNPRYWYSLADDIRQTVWRETRIPVGVGIAPTPTLAKVASFAGKRINNFDGVAVLDSKKSQREVLAHLATGDVWGIGKRISARMKALGILSALQLADQNPKGMRKLFSVEIERTVRELNGEICFSWDTIKAPKQQIFASRSFGTRVTSLSELSQSVTHHAQRVGRKLRLQNSLAGGLKIFAHSNPLKAQHYSKSIYHQFVTPTDDDRQIVSAATNAIEQIYKSGVQFMKSGVGIIEIIDRNAVQSDMFAVNTATKDIMPCLDAINAKFGNDSIKIAGQGLGKTNWAMKREYLSPQFTTKWSDIPKFNC